MKTQAGRGYSLLEMTVVLAILAVLMAISAPNLRRLVERQRARAAADALMQDLHDARELAVLGAEPVHLSFGGTAGHWCWGVNRGAACDCASARPVCNVSRTDGARFEHVSLDHSAGTAFEPRGQAPQAGAATFGTKGGDRYQVQVSLLGLAHACREGSTC